MEFPVTTTPSAPVSLIPKRNNEPSSLNITFPVMEPPRDAEDNWTPLAYPIFFIILFATTNLVLLHDMDAVSPECSPLITFPLITAPLKLGYTLIACCLAPTMVLSDILTEWKVAVVPAKGRQTIARLAVVST